MSKHRMVEDEETKRILATWRKHEKMDKGRRQGTVTGVFYGHSTQAMGTFITWTESITTYTLMYKHAHRYGL